MYYVSQHGGHESKEAQPNEGKALGDLHDSPALPVIPKVISLGVCFLREKVGDPTKSN